ncbi:MAG: diacylglycerol/polyprenol kinase family protein [Methanoregula sp.]
MNVDPAWTGITGKPDDTPQWSAPFTGVVTGTGQHPVLLYSERRPCSGPGCAVLCPIPGGGIIVPEHPTTCIMREIVRQLIHLCFGLGIAAMVLFLDHAVVIAVLAGGLLIGVVLIDLILRGYRVPVISPLVQYGDRSDPLPGKGAFFFAVSALACIILFPVTIVVPALVALSVLDSVTTLAGIRFGRHRISNGKSWEGTLSGIAVTVPALLPFLTLPGAVAASVVAGIIELLSPVDDNLLIPVGVCILLTLVPALV